MNRKISALSASVVATLALGLAGCSGGEPSKVSGLRDDVKHKAAVAAVYKPATRTVTDYRNQCTTKTRTKFVSGKSRTETYQDCSRIQTGSHVETYRKLVKSGKPALYCVELDNVNGKASDDDQWFEVTASTYVKMARKDEGDAVKDMQYSRKLLSCKQ